MHDFKLTLDLLIRSAELATAWKASAEKAEAERDALAADNARLRQRMQNQTDQINGLERSRRRLESLMAGADRRVEVVEAENTRLRDAIVGLLPEAVNDRYITQSVAVEKARAALTGKADT